MVGWLQELGDPADLLAGVPAVKVRHFSAGARSLDAAELKDVTAPNCYTLPLSLIGHAQIQGRGDLSAMGE